METRLGGGECARSVAKSYANINNTNDACSFYGDVWTSSDKGRTWTLKTKKAGKKRR